MMDALSKAAAVFRKDRRFAATRYAISLGVAMGGATIVGYVLSGGTNLTRFGYTFPLPLVLGMNVAATTLAGLLVDYLRPRARSRVMGALIGIVVAIPVFCLIYVVASPVQLTATRFLKSLAIFSVLAGGSAGIVLWSKPRQ